MPISAAELREWIGRKGAVDLSSLEGGERLRTRFVSFITSRHQELVARYLKPAEAEGSFAVEQRMLGILAAVTQPEAAPLFTPPGPYELLEEWAKADEDAYELLNLLRPENS